MEQRMMIGRPKRRFPRILAWGAAGLAASFFLANWAWKASGSNRWELKRDENGTKVWTLKTPGARLVKVKAVKRVQASLSGLVKLIEEPSSCEDVGCYDSRMLQRIDPLTGYTTFRFDMPFPFKTREYVILSQHSQDPATRKIEINLLAAPNKTLPDGKSVRVQHMHNIWRLTPMQDGQVEVEYVQDIDLGGSIPTLMTNLFLPEVGFRVLEGLPALMEKAKFKTASLGHVLE